MSAPQVPTPPDDDQNQAPRAAGLLATVSARIDGMAKVDPALYRAVEVVREADGRLAQKGQIWHRDLSRARRFGYALAANSSAQRVQIADAAGTVLEVIPPPPPGSPLVGWGAWQDLPLPPMPPRPPPARKALPAQRKASPAPPVPSVPAASAAAGAPTVAASPMPRPPFEPDGPENEVERTRTLPPV